jgi:hypothetical protein
MLFAQFLSSLNLYDVEEIYDVQDVGDGALAITKYERNEEIKKVLIPIRLDMGRYRVAVRTVDTNLYEIIGKDIYIKT